MNELIIKNILLGCALSMVYAVPDDNIIFVSL